MFNRQLSATCIRRITVFRWAVTVRLSAPCLAAVAAEAARQLDHTGTAERALAPSAAHVSPLKIDVLQHGVRAHEEALTVCAWVCNHKQSLKAGHKIKATDGYVACELDQPSARMACVLMDQSSECIYVWQGLLTAIARPAARALLRGRRAHRIGSTERH